MVWAEEWNENDSFESGDFSEFSWSQSGNSNWTIDSDASDGSYAAKSGTIVHSQSSSISVSTDMGYLPGSVTFSFKTATADVYDYLVFSIDGNTMGRWSGINEWSDTTFAINTGNHTLSWEYIKFNESSGSCGSGQVADCSGDGDCCSESWIGDGTADCVAQTYGCDLTCYENDGGDCSEPTSTEDAVWVDNITLTGHNIVVNAGVDINQNFDHDGVAGGDVQMDGTNTYPNSSSNLSIPGIVNWFQTQMKWYKIDDLSNHIAIGPNPTINLTCTMPDDGGVSEVCESTENIVLKVAFGAFSQSDTVQVTITEPNQYPILTATSSIDTVYIANNNGIPGNSTLVNLMSQFSDQISFSDPDVLSDGTTDQLSMSWSNSENESLTPLQNLVEGNYQFTLTVTDPYDATAQIDLQLEMIEVNEYPTVTIAAMDNTQIGENQNIIEGNTVDLYGFVVDDDNDLDGSTSTTADDVTYSWNCIHNGSAISVTDNTLINASFIAPDVATNDGSELVECVLVATDPFQAIYGTSMVSDTVSITAYNDNQPPVINVSSNIKPSVNEDLIIELSLSDLTTDNFISITDPDSDTEFTFVIEEGDNYTLTNNVVIPDENYYGEIEVPITVDDGFMFNGELYQSTSETVNLVIDVVGVNDAPVLSGANSTSTEEDTDVSITGMSVSDNDIDGILHDYNLKFDISSTNGTITLNQTVGLNFTVGDGSEDIAMTFTSSVSNFNNAISNITFHPDENYFGPDASITVAVNDQGNFGIQNGSDPEELTDTHEISISVTAVNDAPFITVPSSTSVDEDGEVVVTGFSITDIDVDTYSMEMEVSVENGVITLGETTGIEFDYGDGIEDEQVSFSGGITAINNVLNSITFTPNQHFNGDVVMSAEVNDLGAYGSGGILSGENTFVISVNPINDAPEGVNDSFTLFEGDELTGNVLDNEIDLDETNGSSPASHYALSINTTPVVNVANGSLSLTSDGTFIYKPFAYYNGEDSFPYEVIDGEGATSQATVTITVAAVNNAPELDFPTARTTNEDTEIVIMGISVSDQDIDDSDMEINLSVENGYLTLGATDGLSFSLGDGDSDATLIFSGTRTNIANAISPITFIPAEHYNGDVFLQVEINDLGGNGVGGPLTASGQLQITVVAINDTPTAVEDEGETDEDTILTGNVLTNDVDLDSSNGTSPSSHYTLSVNALPISNVSNGVLTLSSDGSFTYEPYDDYFGEDSFTYELNDEDGESTQGVVTITVNAVNDAPTLQIPTDKYTDEDTPIDISDILVNDIDIADSEMKMDIFVENAGITLSTVDGLSFIAGDGENDSQLTFTGSMDNINVAANIITFTPEEHFNGVVTVQVTINDIGGNGSGGDLEATGEFTVTIDAVNDAPEINSPGTQGNDEDNEFAIYGLNVDDLDAGESTNEVQLSMSAENGRISLYTLDGLTFTTGDGELDSEMIFTGDITNINASLNGLTFLGNEHYNGEDTISITIDDLGNTGTGGALTAFILMPIYLDPINDPPVNQLNNGEDSPPQITVSGIQITATSGNWNDKIDTDISLTVPNITYTYQWQRASLEDGSDAADIVGETSDGYTITNLDAQKYLRVKVTATDDGVGLPSSQSTIAFSEFHYVDNSPPIPQNIGYNIYEDNVLTVDAPGVITNDDDPDDDPLTAEVVLYPENGEVNLSLNGSFVYTPDENFNGEDQFEYRVHDGALYGNTNAIVTIDVNPVNDVPIFTSGGNIETSENLGEVNFFGWATNISDGDPELTQAIEFILTAENPDLFEVQPSIDPVSGTLTFAAYDNLNGDSDVTVTLKDNGGLDNEGVDETDPILFNINIIPINDSPTFVQGDDITVLEDSGEFSQDLWATELDDGDAELSQSMSFTIVSNDNSLLFSSQPTIDENGRLSFELDNDKNGVATVIVTLVDDGSSVAPNSNTSEEKTFTITVTPVNDVPQWTVSNNIEILEDAGEQNVLNFITEIDDGDPEVTQTLTFNLIDVSNFALFAETPSIDATGKLTYLIEEDMNGSSLVYFTLSDDGGIENGGVNQTGQQFFEITVIAVNDAPTFEITEVGVQNEDLYSVEEIIVTPHLPPNDEGNQSVQYSLSSLEAVNDKGVSFATLTINNSTGNVSIYPITDGNGIDTLTIVANDGSGTENDGEESFEQSFVFKVNPVNDPPVNVDLPQISGNPYVDSLLTVSDGVWNDELDTLFSGSSEITYEYAWQRAADSEGTDLQFISDALFNEYTVVQDDYHQFLRVRVIAADTGYSLTGDEATTVIYSDFIEILNTPPVAVNDSYEVNEDLTLSISFEDGLISGWTPGSECVRFDNVYVADCDRDGDSLVVELASDVSFGSLTLEHDGSFIYYPDTNRNEINMNLIDNVQVDEFTYTVTDGEGSSLPATVSIQLHPVNDAPIFELTNVANEVISSVDVYEDFATQTVKVLTGLIPDDETGQNVEYSIDPTSVSFANISIDSNTGEVTIEKVDDDYGNQDFTVIAIDDGGTDLNGENTYTQNFTLNITSVNDVPSFVKGDDQPILEDAGLQTIESWATNISRGPADEITQLLGFNITSTNDEFFSQYPSVDPTTGTLTYQIADDLNGDVSVTLTISDDGGTDFGGVDTSEPQSFEINVTAVNDAPSFILGANLQLEIDEDGIGKSVDSWITSISKGPINELGQSLQFTLTTDRNDSTIFSEFPTINEDSGTVDYGINDNFNGTAEVTVYLSDDGGTENGGVDRSPDQEFKIRVHQINDEPRDYIVHPRVYEYADDTTTFFFDIENEDTSQVYYRLPYQIFAPASQPDSLLKFAWESNDSLDIDTYSTLNFDSTYTLYYRLEGIPSDNSKVYVLKDDINYMNYLGDDSVIVFVDMTSQFPVYDSTFDPDSVYATETIDTTGVTSYSWRVIAQNYSKDRYNDDPTKVIDSNIDMKVDLELPEAEFSFFQNDLFPDYYDLYFMTNEETIDSVARVWIDFEGYTQNLFPYKLDDSLYHVSSSFIKTGLVKYNFQVRDKRLNLGRSLDTVYYEVVLPETSTLARTPDDFLNIYYDKGSIEYSQPIIITNQILPDAMGRFDSEIISDEYHFMPYNLSFNKPYSISVNHIDTEEPLWRYKFVEHVSNRWEVIETNYENNQISAWVNKHGVFALAYFEDASEPLPDKFELVGVYPNPFNPITTIDFAIPQNDNVKVDVYNIRGQLVTTLLNEMMDAGYHQLQWNINNGNSKYLASGIYFISISYADNVIKQKVTLLK